MFCPKCGKQNLETSNFCKGCGAPLRESGQQRAGGNLSSGNHLSQGVSPGGFPARVAHPFNLVGQVIDGKYLLEAKLGTGGTGDVYRAARQFIGDTVAVKILHLHLAQNSQAVERFRREARTAVRLKHANAVSLYDVGISAQGWLYIVMELVEGETLRQIISRHKILPLDFIVTVTAQTCAALSEAHKMDIIHRDIKPENIIVRQTATGWQVKVLDFGIAKLQDETAGNLTVDGSAMGTPQYMSPEQCLGEPLDARADVYSLGILLYEMLCGTVPFRAATSSAVALLHIQTPCPSLCSINPKIAPQVEAVVLRALEKGREKRQPTVVALSQELIQAATQAFRDAPASAPSGASLPIASFVSGEQDTAPPIQTPQFSSSGLILTNDEEQSRNGIVSSPTPVPISQTSNEQPTVDLRVVPPFADTPATESSHTDAIVFESETFVNNDSAQTSAESVAVGATAATAETFAENSGEPVAVLSAVSEENQILSPLTASAAAPALRRNFLYFAVTAAGLLVLGIGAAVGVWYFSSFNARNETLSLNREQAENKPPQLAAPVPPPGMVLIPGGEFMMGDDNGDEYARPAHVVAVKPFFMDITEVTNEEYQKFVDVTGHKPPGNWKGGRFPAGKEKFPVTGVTWDDATAYAKWVGKRLPTEAEWEFAARGTDRRRYPWGDEWQPEMANADNKIKGMQAVGTGKGVSPFGNYDMIGNAWEWTADDARAYPSGKEFPPNSIDPKIIRGGCWLTEKKDATTAFRTFWGARAENDYSNTGFRCAQDAASK